MSLAEKLSFKSGQRRRERPAVKGRWHNPAGSVLETGLFLTLRGSKNTLADADRLRRSTHGTQTVAVRFGVFMEHYLLKLSYSTTGWKDIVQKAPTFDERLGPVRDLLAKLGGSFASFHFYEREPYRNDKLQHVVLEKFGIFGRDDLFAVLAFQDRHSAQAFRIALSTQPGIKSVELVSIMPFEEVIADSVGKAKAAITGSKYAGPG